MYLRALRSAKIWGLIVLAAVVQGSFQSAHGLTRAPRIKVEPPGRYAGKYQMTDWMGQTTTYRVFVRRSQLMVQIGPRPQALSLIPQGRGVFRVDGMPDVEFRFRTAVSGTNDLSVVAKKPLRPWVTTEGDELTRKTVWGRDGTAAPPPPRVGDSR